MNATTMYELAKLRMSELQQEAERERLARRAREPRGPFIGGISIRGRLARLRGIRPVRSGGPRTART
jgi:hypothetical protein